MNLKKNYLLLLIFIFTLISPLCAKPKKHKLVKKTVYITVEHICSKNRPSFWGGDSDVFYYGDELKAVDSDGQWLKVESDKTGKSGWVKESVLTTRKIKSKGIASVNAEELALAGKGFESNIETEQKDSVEEFEDSFGNALKTITGHDTGKEDREGENAVLKLPPDKYADEVESVSISDEELKEFILEGELRGDE